MSFRCFIGFCIICTIEIPFGVCDQRIINCVTFQHCFCKVKSNNCFVCNCFVNCHGLFSIYDVCKVSFVTILSCDQNVVFACIVRFDSLCNTKCCGVIGAKSYIKLCSVCIVRSEDVLHSFQSCLCIPCCCCYGIEISLSGNYIQCACIQIRFQSVISTVEEVSCIVICRVTCCELDVICFITCIVKIQSIDYVLALQSTYCIVIEGDIIGNCIGFDQTVISDNRDSCICCFIHNCIKCFTIDSCNYQEVNSIGDQVLDIIYLTVCFVIGVCQLYIISSCFKLFFQIRTISVPTFQRLCWH